MLSGDFGELSRSQRITLVRVVKEALTNVRKNSGASQVEVEVTARGSIAAEITDDGEGFDVDTELLRAARKGRLGLVGMAERVQLLGGTLEVDSRPGGPTRITLAMPKWTGSAAGEDGCPPG